MGITITLPEAASLIRSLQGGASPFAVLAVAEGMGARLSEDDFYGRDWQLANRLAGAMSRGHSPDTLWQVSV